MLSLRTREHLQQLEGLLREQELWADTPPDAAALASRTPFACDTLAFEQWLQFIFLPRMNALLDGGHALPTNIAITPMAFHVWQNQPERAALIHLLNDLDTLLNEPG
ncbi:MAG: YqcC family protein [Shewanella sp.]|nr:YqcC family protein [Shewanella sp.]MCF1429323.1 YqcC family protein [Shewanella sp.]MCF1439633.1 YqcC family protein [Shewanella sp.]MCF1456529.1 YqcC family protein [Shewanella sp.]